MTLIKAEDMHCEKCKERISRAMGEAGLNFEVDLDEKTISIGGGSEEVKAALEILDDLGFEGVVQE